MKIKNKMHVFIISPKTSNELVGESIGRRLNGIGKQQQAMVRLQIEQIFFNAENPPIPFHKSQSQNDEPF